MFLWQFFPVLPCRCGGGCPFHLLFYDPVIVKPLKAIIVIKGYANTLDLTLWKQTLKFDLTEAFQHEKPLKSVMMHTFPRAFPAHGFVTTASSLATGPVGSDPAAKRNPLTCCKGCLRAEKVTTLRVCRSSFHGALNQCKWAAADWRS